MSDLIASSLSVAFGPRPLFTDVSLTVDPGDRIALVGPNGAGKTTLLRVLAGRLDPSAGDVRVPSHLQVALHDQRPERSDAILRDFAAPPRMVAMEQRLRALELEMASGDEAIMHEWQQVRTEYEVAGAEGWHVQVEAVLRGLGFRSEQLDQPLTTLSGGELTRAALARTLAQKPEVLLLDEPTNHLDIETITWLQDYLESLPGGLVLVSHDRWFIESVCTSVIEIAYGKSRHFNGSFVEYRAQQAMEAVTHQRGLEKWKDEVARLQRFVDRFSAGTRSKQAQSRAKRIDQLRQDVPAYTDLGDRRGLGFKLPKVEQPGRTVFDIRQISLGFGEPGEAGERTLLDPTDMIIERGEKVALLGRNGSGKSTLLTALAAETIPLVKEPAGLRDGEIRVGYAVKTRLLSQHDSELVDNQSMLGNMQLASPGISRTQAQNLLGLFGFSGDDAERLVGTMSGGERRRLLMSMALTGSDNVLLLDEPTNHLDIESREALESALNEYQGTVLLISHDRALVEGVATRTIILHDRTITTMLGGYTQAAAVLSGEQEADAGASGAAGSKGGSPKAGLQSGSKPRSKTDSAVTAAPTMTASSPSAKKAPDAASRKVTRGKTRTSGAKPKVRRPSTIEGELIKLEDRLTEVQQLMLDPDVYTSAEKSATALAEHDQLERDIAVRYTELELALEVHG